MFPDKIKPSGPGNLLSCGCYSIISQRPKYLPRLNIDVHTIILDTVSHTTLTQAFINPIENKSINDNGKLDEIHYVFPLDDGVSVVGFTCSVDGKVLKGIVKERQTAKKEYTEARKQGQLASLFEHSLQAADVFNIAIGNVAPGERVVVTLTYLREHNHDTEVDGLRVTIPSHIIPRDIPIELPIPMVEREGMTVTVDVEMPTDSVITSIDSTTHPISVSIGNLSTTKDSEPSLRKGSATLSQASVGFDKDFVIRVAATKLGDPSAFIETHPAIPNQRALMTTLVPKFNLPIDKPEIVFICDCSGSMHDKIKNLLDALVIFLKSLPLGIKFNICSFGSTFHFLWPRSKSYNQETMEEAMKYIQVMCADYGGTEMYEPLQTAFQNRYKDLNLEVFLLTDGEVWYQQHLFNLIRENVDNSDRKIRVFSLGVGSGASSSFIQGVARAGNGFSQTVLDDEKMGKKVVRMLKGALMPHINDYSLEIKYENAVADDEEDFEVVEKVVDSLHLETGKIQLVDTTPKPTISLHSSKFEETDISKSNGKVGGKYDHLPTIDTPRYLQTPTNIPPLFPFIRSTIYVLLSDSDLLKNPKSVLLKATSQHGPLELEIPIVNLPGKSTTIHQLAARREMIELEEGRGWLNEAKDKNGQLLRDKFESKFSDMVEKEAVRIGLQYQVTGKWCSFVAMEKVGSRNKAQEETTRIVSSVDEFAPPYSSLSNPPPIFDTSLVDTWPEKARPRQKGTVRYRRKVVKYTFEGDSSDQDSEPVEESGSCKTKLKEPISAGGEPVHREYIFPGEDMKSEGSSMDGLNDFQAIVSLQKSTGHWMWDEELEERLGVDLEDLAKLNLPSTVVNHDSKGSILATSCAVMFLKKRQSEDKEVWEMLVDKAEDWLRDQVGEDIGTLGQVVESLL